MLSSRGGFGEIRPHGILLAAEARDLSIVIASANATELGVPAERLLGTGISTVLAAPLDRQLREWFEQTDIANPIPATSIRGDRYDAILHRADDVLVIELEPVREHVGLGILQRAIERLRRAHRANEIERIAVEEIRVLLGFDRVALYRKRAGSLALSVALPDDGHPPAPLPFDLEEQPAYIANRSAPGVPLIASSHVKAFDMRRCVLRNVALEPGAGAWCAIPLDEWGVVVCEHPVPRLVPYGARAAAHIIARLVAWHLAAHDVTARDLRARAAAQELENTRIIVVDDDVDGGEMLGELLRAVGATVEIARSAAQALERIRTFRPDALVSDISLPDKDGFTFIRELRATGSEEGGWIPAIAISGHSEPEIARDAILAGFQLYIPKPIDASDLIARLGRLVGRTARRT